MKAKIILLCVLCTLVLGCKKDTAENDVSFAIANNSSGNVKEIYIRVIDSEKSIDAIKLSNLAINNKETKVINLSSFKLKGDGSYKAGAVLADGKTIEKTFGYLTNGVDMNTRGYTIEISNSEILIK